MGRWRWGLGYVRALGHAPGPHDTDVVHSGVRVLISRGTLHGEVTRG